MRKIIIAATTIASLAVPAISMAAHSTVVPSRTVTPYTAQYVDGSGPGTETFTISGVHIVKVAKQASNSRVEDKMTVKITDPSGKPFAEFADQAGATINWPTGWASDSPVDLGQLATSMVAHINAKGTGFTAIATYPVS